MQKIELAPDLKHCIETVAKREHAAVLRQLLSARGPNKELEERLETLRLFLERADFRQLRRESEIQLTKGRRVKFTLYLDNGVPKHEIQVT